MIQKFGFDFGDPFFSFDGLEFAFRICTLENVYGIDPDQVKVTQQDNRLNIETASLQFAGGQKRCPGRLMVEIWKDGPHLKFQASGAHQETIKGITTLIRELAKPVSQKEEKIYTWPSLDLNDSPFPEIETESDETVFIMPHSTALRFRRWAVYQAYAGYSVFNLSEDEAYTNRSNQMTGSVWTLTRDTDRSAVIGTWYEMLEKERGLRPWAERTDVPTWFQDVSLVLNMHCEGWTGYVFNTFDRQLEILQWIAERIDGHRVLVYLPGWDGRYYWNYPIYKPSEACGGSEGLQRLTEGAQALGMHVVPMFGLIASNYANTQDMGFQDAACRTAYDIEETCDWTEWDEDLSTEPNWQPLNVGEEKFRTHLLERIYAITERFGMDGAMLDISGWMPRDPRHDLVDGLSKIVNALQARYDDYLIFGENGCDLHLPLMPLFHHGTHLPSYHPFHRYCRSAYHLYTAAPGEGSTGVFEGGLNIYNRPDVDHPAIPTLSVVQDTLPDHAKEVEKVIGIAEEWAERQISKLANGQIYR